MSTLKQFSFSGGEIGPSLYGRVDLVKYATGARTVRNMFVQRHGGVSNRPGTVFIGEVKDSSKTVRLIPFVFNSSQTYALEFGDQYLRVIRSGSYQSDLSLTITGISNANPGVVTYTGTDPVNGEEVYISGVVGGMANYINGRNFKIANVNTVANTFQLKDMAGNNFNTTSIGSYTSGGTAARIYTISTPYLEADLADLQFVQSADVITIVHKSYAPRKLSRSGHTSWSLTSMSFAPEIDAPTGLTGGVGGTTYYYVVTAVKEETYEESLPSTPYGVTGTSFTLSWTAVTGAAEYNVYRKVNGVFGLIGVAGTNSFTDSGLTTDLTDTPPTARNPFSGADDYPGVVSYYQQRLCLGSTNNDPENVWASRSGQYTNFTISSPIQDDDAVTFAMAGRQVNEVRHLIDLGKLIVITSGGEWVVDGGADGILTPTQINSKQYSYNGGSKLAPIFIGGNILYVQARGSLIRDFAYDYQVDGYRGNDLTIFSAHLVSGYTIVDWAYQQIPHSIVWAVRDDGVLLGLTYVKEHQVFGWHKHDFDGEVENVVSIPEGTEDYLYLVIKRTINGSTKRYVERLATRTISDIEDSIFSDCALSYDGRNTGSQTMTLTGSGWTYTDTLTLTSSASYFSASDVGNAIHITGSDGTLIRCTITGYTSATVVSVLPNKLVPVAMRSVAITDWSRAVDTVSGLWHLEGKDVSVFADGFVVASPNNASYTTLTVTNGSITLDRPYSVIHVGLPYVSDLETLDVDTTQGETLADKKKNVVKLTVYVESTRGMWAGGKPPTDDDSNPLEDLYEPKIRDAESYDSPVELQTGIIEIDLKPEWNSNGRLFIRQVDPLPMTILAVAPYGMYPIQGGS